MSDDNKNANSPNLTYKSTPPPSRKVRNPFDRVLMDRLTQHKLICSPGMCKRYKKKQSGIFRWDIDQISTIKPADIVACNSQFEPSPDPALERIAEEVTEKFFSQEIIMPSPLIESSKKVKPLQISSCDASIKINSLTQSMVITREVSAQTVLTLPPELPPELEKLLKPYFTFTQNQDISGEYEITANGSLRRKLFYEEHSDVEHYDSEQTDDEIHVEPPPPSNLEEHTPVIFSPDSFQIQGSAEGMERTFGTPLKNDSVANKPCYRNKILDVVDFEAFSPIECRTPQRADASVASSSLTSVSISPVTKATSSDEEKNNFTSPESETMATCLNCIASETDSVIRGPCFCKLTPNKVILTRSKSLKESPPRSRKGSISEKRSLSMTSLHRSRSVQKLDFSMDMSVDGSLHDHSQDSVFKTAEDKGAIWSIVENSSVTQILKEVEKSYMTERSLQTETILDKTPIKGKTKSNSRSHEISKIRIAMPLSPLEMSLDCSVDSDDPLNLEDKKIDFNTVDLKFLTENVSQLDYTAAETTKIGDGSTSFKKLDSGFNEHTFYANASSYYESAIKPSELTVTNVSSKSVLKEISNVHWMRADSGFKDEASVDCTQFYPNETQNKKLTSFNFSEAKMDKENTEDFDRFLVQSNKNDAMSMSDIFTDDMTFNCNFSSTPSKNKTRKVNS